MEQSLPSTTPHADKFGILLKPACNSNQEEEEGSNELKMIGLVGTKDPGDEVVYMLHCDFWHQGYMSEALAAFLGPRGIFWRLERRLLFTHPSFSLLLFFFSFSLSYFCALWRREKKCRSAG
jgi:hypothetical protein